MEPERRELEERPDMSYGGGKGGGAGEGEARFVGYNDLCGLARSVATKPNMCYMGAKWVVQLYIHSFLFIQYAVVA